MKEKYQDIWIGVLLAIIAGLAYLPLVGLLGHYQDDWYLMYAARVSGPSVFKEIFAVDRPARALVMIPAYILFGEKPLPYNLAAFAFRLLSGLCYLWMLRMLWPRRHSTATWAALLFLIYPGFLSQPNAIDYLCHIVGLAAAMLSLALTVKAMLTVRLPGKVVFFGLSILLGWFYLGQMEYYIGFEAARLGLIILLANRQPGGWKTVLHRTIQTWLPLAVIPVFFLAWRLFFFESERGATDIGPQLVAVVNAPLHTLASWGIYLLQDVFNVLFLAWTIPLSRIAFALEVKAALAGLGIAALAFAAAWFGLRRVQDQESVPGIVDWHREAFWLGLVWVLAGIVPVILVGRHIIFPAYSRYTLVSLGGALLILAVLFDWLKDIRLRQGLLSLLVASAVFTHFANGLDHAQETATIHDFWWQVSWRVPQLQQNTTLIANYPKAAIEEDYFIWGPANQIYYPQGTNDKYAQPGVFAALLNHETVVKVVRRERQEFDNRRSIRTYKNYRNILILSKPSEDSCVQVISALQPEFSSAEREDLMLIAPYTEIERIILDSPARIPPEIFFGAEPAHGWCYYYQKANLARQREDWDAVFSLAEEARTRGLLAKDLVEWMPFLQVYAIFNDVERVTEISGLVSVDPFVAMQACRILSAMPNLSTDIQEQVKSLLCVEP